VRGYEYVARDSPSRKPFLALRAMVLRYLQRPEPVVLRRMALAPQLSAREKAKVSHCLVDDCMLERHHPRRGAGVRGWSVEGEEQGADEG